MRRLTLLVLLVWVILSADADATPREEWANAAAFNRAAAVSLRDEWLTIHTTADIIVRCRARCRYQFTIVDPLGRELYREHGHIVRGHCRVTGVSDVTDRRRW